MEDGGVNYVHVLPALGTAQTLLGDVTGTGETKKSVVTGFADEASVRTLTDELENRFGTVNFLFALRARDKSYILTV